MAIKLLDAVLRYALILLDEPWMGLDPKTLKQVFQTITLMHGSGRTILLVEQNVLAGLGLCTRGVVMESGQVRLADAHRKSSIISGSATST